MKKISLKTGDIFSDGRHISNGHWLVDRVIVEQLGSGFLVGEDLAERFYSGQPFARMYKKVYNEQIKSVNVMTDKMRELASCGSMELKSLRFIRVYEGRGRFEIEAFADEEGEVTWLDREYAYMFTALGLSFRQSLLEPNKILLFHGNTIAGILMSCVVLDKRKAKIAVQTITDSLQVDDNETSDTI